MCRSEDAYVSGSSMELSWKAMPQPHRRSQDRCWVGGLEAAVAFVYSYVHEEMDLRNVHMYPYTYTYVYL